MSSAAEKLSTIGWWLGEVLAPRDLLVCALPPADHEVEGIARLKVAIERSMRLLGTEPAQADLDTCCRHA